MKKHYQTWMILIVSSFFIFSCNKEDALLTGNPLTANAGEDCQTRVNTLITLDGSASKDKEGEAFTAYWRVKSQPDSSQAVLTDSAGLTTGFMADKPGGYVIELSLSKYQWNAFDEVLVTVIEANTSQAVIISDDIIADRVLEDVFTDDFSRVDYLVSTTISVDACLTIKPGVKVAFAKNAGMVISATGSFISEGGETESEMVYLTGESETSGYWGGLLFLSASDKNSISHTSLSCAGAKPDQNSFSTGVYLHSGSKISINHAVFSNNAGMGLFVSPDAQLISFSSNKLVGDPEADYVMALPASEVGQLSNDCLFLNLGIAVLTSALNSGASVSWGSYNYTLLSGLEVSQGTRLTIAPQARIYVNQNERIAVLSGGSITAVSQDANPIFISGIENQAGYWQGILIENSGNNPSKFQYVSIRNAGSTPLAGDNEASLHLGPNAKVAFDDSFLGLGAGDGIEATSEGATLLSFNGNVIREHAGYPMVVSTQNVAVIDYWSYFVNNGKNQVRVDGNIPIASDNEVVWNGFQQTNMSYHIKGLSNDLVVWSGLRLNEGAILEMEPGSRILVENANNRQAYLRASGSEAKNVVFKAANGLAGSWYGITISSTNAQNYFENVQVLHGGKLVDNSFSANITIDNSPEGSLTLLNSVVAFSGQHGIAIANTMRDNLIDTQLTYWNIPGDEVYTW